MTFDILTELGKPLTPRERAYNTAIELILEFPQNFKDVSLEDLVKLVEETWQGTEKVAPIGATFMDGKKGGVK